MPDLNVSFKEQYLKSLTFKQKHLECNPASAEFSTDTDIEISKLGENVYESNISLEVNATENKKNVFQLSMVYSGIFLIENASEEELSILLKEECPKLLFPFIREIVSKISREAGFREIILNPTMN